MSNRTKFSCWPNRTFAYKSLIRKYENREGIEASLKRINSDKKTYHAKMRTRIAYFLKTKRRRFVYLFIFLAAFQSLDNILKFVGARMERNFKRFKEAWVYRKYPELFVSPTAQLTNFKTKTLSTQTEQVLGERFVELNKR